ncbi:cytochrome-c peroxidase [Ferrimonas balearica]|uniref:cytochrome-c peroxidase n=1 Tax=Ferrimonas balearica TaxID=44012 RepID=UPI0021BD3AC8|nr:cytochrome c peroxidase [Ferrimonas balearica]
MKTQYYPTLLLALVLLGACGGSDSTSSLPEGDPAPEPTPPSSRWTLPDALLSYADQPLPRHFEVNDFAEGFQFQNSAIDNDNTPDTNPITDAGATLGRVLFYDPWLSENRSISCANCHQQAVAFSDPRTLSLGVDGGETRRHAMGLGNARFYQSGKFFWDERAETLEQQVLMPIEDPVEMGMTLDDLVERLQSDPFYPPLFADAFGDEAITAERIGRALAQFVRSLVSFNARYDLGRAQVTSPLDPFPNFSDQENQGKALFMRAASCGACHISEAFVGPTPLREAPNIISNATNNGLDAVSSDDLGLAETTGNPLHEGRFKAPSLRNIEVTAPYMHDGRFATLESVVIFYNEGIQPHANLAAVLQEASGAPRRFGFSDQEVQALVAFLRTLTDPQFLTDPRFADPFIAP